MPVIKTKNFILRPFKKGDEVSLAKNINHKKIYRNTWTVPYPYNLKHGKEFIRKDLKEQRKKKPAEINFAIDINKEVIGGIGFKEIESHQAEIHYWLAPKCHNKGIMTLALKKMTKYGFEKLKVRRIYACVFPFNKASMRILEKNHYKLEGILRKEVKKGRKLFDDHLFAKVR